MNGKAPFKSGFIGIIGAPNVGKSTLLNRIMGQKIAITSRRPQTTRNRIMGVCHLPQAQLVFLDTPGIHRARGALNRRIVDVAMGVLGDANLLVLMIDGPNGDSGSEGILVDIIRQRDVPVILVINKVDIMKKEAILPLIERWRQDFPFESIVPVSALKGENVDSLVEEMVKLLPEGPPYYPEETFTDVSQRFVAAEIIREKVFRCTGAEIPYAVAVVVDAFKIRPEKRITDIVATIYVERASQKPIVIGRKGEMLKRIGAQARVEIEEMIGGKAFLKLWVRVRKNWTKDERVLQEFGY